MLHRINLHDQMLLLTYPETGMGYQVIEAKEALNYEIKRFIVLNSEIAINLDPLQQKYIKQAFTQGFEKTKQTAPVALLRGIKVLSKHEAFRSAVKESSSTLEKGARENKIEFANGTELFVRLSAYANDKRVDKANKKLLPGSFATTSADYAFCRTNGLDPIDRYALPNDEPIKFAFHIQPKKGDELQRGKTQPANNHNGGGEEVYFGKGTSNDTMLNNGEPKPY